MISLITLPSFDGFNPKSDLSISFSIAGIKLEFYGCITISLGSGAEMLPTCFKGVTCP